MKPFALENYSGKLTVTDAPFSPERAVEVSLFMDETGCEVCQILGWEELRLLHFVLGDRLKERPTDG